MKIIYVGGSVRSGTTILDMLLGMNPATLAVGEVNLFFRQIARIENPVPCSCGKTLRECPLWSQVLVHFQAALPEMSLERADAITRQVETYPEQLINGSRSWNDYVSIWHTMFTAIHAISGATCVVDSSKTGRHSLCRPRSLAQAGFETNLLHMVRDPRAVAWSQLRREIDKGHLNNNSALFRSAVAASIHWCVTNVSTNAFYRRQSTVPYCEIRYEDFMDDPVGALQTAQTRFGIDLSRCIEIVQKDEPIDSGHLASGNEIRLKAPVYLRKQPPTWKTALPRPARLGVLVSSPVAHFFHYHVSDYH